MNFAKRRRLLGAIVITIAFARPGRAQVPLLPLSVSEGGEAQDVAMSADGSFVVNWVTGDVRARRFDAQGSPVGWLSLDSDNIAHASSIARDASGRTVVVWTDGWYVIRGRRFAADGNALGDSFLVTAAAGVGVNDPRVASDPGGNFMVAWTSSGSAVVARAFDSNGEPRGYEFPVNAGTTGFHVCSGIAASPAGFVVIWHGDGPSGPGVFGRRFGPSGAPLTGDLPISSAGVATQGSDVAMNASGDFVAVWIEQFELRGRRFDASGAPLTPVFPIAPASASSDPRVASDSFGNFLVAWTGDGIMARAFDAAANPGAGEFQVASAGGPYGYLVGRFQARPAIADDGSFVVVWTDAWYYGGSNTESTVSGGKGGLRARGWMSVDPAGNGVIEPGETPIVVTAWANDSAGQVALSGTATRFTGPSGAVYDLVDATASYGTIPAGQDRGCDSASDCYVVHLSAPAVRPARHWDAQLQEVLSAGVPKTWALHVGESFPDVPRTHAFYSYVETLFHNGVTSGCFGGGYCPEGPVTRAQMAVFLLKAKFGAAHVPPPCTGAVFADVPCTGGTFDPWIEELAALDVTGGCGGGAYCPGDFVTREQMAVFLLKTLHGSAYTPPACAGHFGDVPCTPGTGFADWIEELARRGVTGGCSASPALFCPTNPNTRGQMAVFLTRTFWLQLYGGR